MSEILGLILAGGLSRRMGGGDKTLLALGGKPMLAHVIARLRPQIEEMIINANGDPARFAPFGLIVIPDSIPDFAGPLAGILAGMEWALAYRPKVTHLLSVAGDTPFLPLNLLEKMEAERTKNKAEIVLAGSGGRSHPVIGLWPIALHQQLRQAMLEEGLRKIDLFTARYPSIMTEFPAHPIDPFFNANSPEELAEAEEYLAQSNSKK